MITNCPNCAAPIDPQTEKCAYCGTPYLKEAQAAELELHLYPSQFGDAIVSVFDAGLVTANEVRRLFGLRQI